MRSLVVAVLFLNLQKILHCHDLEACGLKGVCICAEGDNGFVVNCADVGLKEIPRHIPRNVSFLHLEENNIKTIRFSEFYNLTNLTVLTFHQNSLETLPSGLFTYSDQLMALLLSRNFINILQPGVFQGLSKLNYLNLSSNAIESIDKNVFRGLDRLANLDLSHNRIHTLPEDLFTFVPKLIRLTLSKNALRGLPERLFSYTYFIEILYVELLFSRLKKPTVILEGFHTHWGSSFISKSLGNQG